MTLRTLTHAFFFCFSVSFLGAMHLEDEAHAATADAQTTTLQSLQQKADATTAYAEQLRAQSNNSATQAKLDELISRLETLSSRCSTFASGDALQALADRATAQDGRCDAFVTKEQVRQSVDNLFQRLTNRFKTLEEQFKSYATQDQFDVLRTTVATQQALDDLAQIVTGCARQDALAAFASAHELRTLVARVVEQSGRFDNYASKQALDALIQTVDGCTRQDALVAYASGDSLRTLADRVDAHGSRFDDYALKTDFDRSAATFARLQALQALEQRVNGCARQDALAALQAPQGVITLLTARVTALETTLRAITTLTALAPAELARLVAFAKAPPKERSVCG